jgi:CheY-like chemotaxis protein
MKILIADDELRLRKVVAMFLKKSGHEIIEVSDGEQALEVIKTNKPDVVVLDVIMPVMNGMEALRKIKASKDCKDIPVILLTANISTADREDGIKAGASAYVTKPFSPKDLLEKILETAGHKE